MTMRALLAVALLLAGAATGLVTAGADSTGTGGTGATVSQTTATANGTNLSVRTLGAPRAAADRLDGSANVTALRRDGLLSNASRVPLNATLVVELGVPGLAAEFGDVDESNATARFRRAVREANVSLAAEQTNPGPQQLPIELDLVNASARVLADRTNDTYYLVVDLRALNAARDGDDPGTNADRQLHGREEFRLNLSVPRSSSLAVSGSAETTVSVARRKADVASSSDGAVLLPRTANATVAGTTTLLPGTPVTVRLRVDGDDGFEATRTVTPSDDRNRYAASFDLSGVANGTPVEVRVVGPTGPLLYEPESGRVVEPTGSVSFLDEPRHVDPSWVRVNAEFAYPSVVVLHEGSRDGPVVGERALASGSHTYVRIYLDRAVERNRTLVAVAVLDVDGDRERDAGEPLVTRNGSAVSDALVFDPVTTTATTTSTRTPTTTGTATRTTSTATTRTSTTTDGQPGFGAAVALGAISIVVLNHRKAK